MTRLEAIQKLLDGLMTEDQWDVPTNLGVELCFQYRGDQDFIIAAPGNTRWLMARVEELRAHLRTLIFAVQMCDDPRLRDRNIPEELPIPLEVAGKCAVVLAKLEASADDSDFPDHPQPVTHQSKALGADILSWLGRAAKVLRVFNEQSAGDFVYNIRDRELKGWDGPLVTAWGNACQESEALIAEMEEPDNAVL